MYVFGLKTYLFGLVSPVSQLISLHFCKIFANDFAAIISIYMEYSEYSVFRILQIYKSQNIPPFAGPFTFNPVI